MAATTADRMQTWNGTPLSDRDTLRAIYPPNSASRRLLGAFYTPHSVAEFMADWVVRHPGERLLEPSFGDGIFLRAAAASAQRRSLENVRLFGVEIAEEPLRQVLSEGLVSGSNAYHGDFLGLHPFGVNAVLGNPPYVRLRQLSPQQRHQALATAGVGLNEPMDPAGSLWLPFVLHSMRFLELAGRLAFVLPYELTYVRYARPLWRTLGNNFGSIKVLRTHERPFPDILQDVVILLADQFGSQTQTVRFEAFERVNDLLDGNPSIEEDLKLDDLVQGKRSFISALLGPELRHLLCSRVVESTSPAQELIRFNIGYVAGDKTFFHPSRRDIEDFGIPPSSLYPALTSARAIRGAGLRTSTLGPEGNVPGSV